MRRYEESNHLTHQTHTPKYACLGSDCATRISVRDHLYMFAASEMQIVHAAAAPPNFRFPSFMIPDQIVNFVLDMGGGVGEKEWLRSWAAEAK